MSESPPFDGLRCFALGCVMTARGRARAASVGFESGETCFKLSDFGVIRSLRDLGVEQCVSLSLGISVIDSRVLREVLGLYGRDSGVLGRILGFKVRDVGFDSSDFGVLRVVLGR